MYISYSLPPIDFTRVYDVYGPMQGLLVGPYRSYSVGLVYYDLDPTYVWVGPSSIASYGYGTIYIGTEQYIIGQHFPSL